VLRGDMSFVGPRPDVPGYADKLEGDDRRILLLKPGITGPASMKYSNEEEILALQPDPIKYNDEVIYPDKVRINLAYLQNQSFLLDLKIIIFTILGKKLTEEWV
jgi:lipopolysaccharide/colanic/teichoic acid biosynthesis glycosyltransferase